MNDWEKEYTNLNKQISVTYAKISIVPRRMFKTLQGFFFFVNYTLHLQKQAKMQNIFHLFSTYIVHLLIQ